jgi:hypothetical protein
MKVQPGPEAQAFLYLISTERKQMAKQTQKSSTLPETPEARRLLLDELGARHGDLDPQQIKLHDKLALKVAEDEADQTQDWTQNP